MLLTSLSFPARGAGYFVDGYQLLQFCQGDQRLEQAKTPRDRERAAIDATRCLGYIEGVWDGLLVQDPATMCMPNIHLGQAEQIVMAFLSGHPELLHHIASELVGTALQQAFQCSRR
jgi:hypothetical protein